MSIPDAIRAVLDRRGCTQAWIVRKMNEISPELGMDRVKFSAIVCGNRKMTGDELLAFCKAVKMNPDELFDGADREVG